MTEIRKASKSVPRGATTGRFVRVSSKSGGATEVSSNRSSIAAQAYALVTYSVVKSGLPAKRVKEYVDEGRLRREDVALVIPRRTFERRLSENQTLKIDEADAIARLLRVRDHARRAFEDSEVAEEWLSLPNPELGNEIPIEMARTDVGAREVEAVLTRFEHGVYG